MLKLVLRSVELSDRLQVQVLEIDLENIRINGFNDKTSSILKMLMVFLNLYLR